MENLSSEVWKPIKNYEDLYQISNMGRVKSLRRNIILSHRNNSKGYSYVNLSHFKNPKTFFIHRLVAQHFLENIEGKNIVNHINEIRHDNRVENLEWCTHSENSMAFWSKRSGKIKNLEILPSIKPIINKMFKGERLSTRFGDEGSFYSTKYLDQRILLIPEEGRIVSFRNGNKEKTINVINQFLERGFYYENGAIYNSRSIPIKIARNGVIFSKQNREVISVMAKFFVWYSIYQDLPYNVKNIDGVKTNVNVSNLKKEEIKLIRFEKAIQKFSVELNTCNKTFNFGYYRNKECALKASEYIIKNLK